jgi:hypothetical protein
MLILCNSGFRLSLVTVLIRDSFMVMRCIFEAMPLLLEMLNPPCGTCTREKYVDRR